MSTTQEQIQFITDECVKANPSIVDLVFGCRVKQKYSVKEFVEVLCSPSENDEGEKYVYTTHGHTSEKVYLERYTPPDNYILEIIGREIHLADVLLAIDKISSQYSVGADGRFTVLDITKDGTSGLEWVKESNGVLALTWNLLKDSLSSQSPETIEFIFNLLK